MTEDAPSLGMVQYVAVDILHLSVLRDHNDQYR